MLKNIKYFFALVLLSSSTLLQAQKGSMADFYTLSAKFKTMATYSYQTENLATFPNGHKEKMNANMYMDGPNKRVLYKNDFQLVVLTPKYAMKVDHQQKTVGVYDVVKYQKANRQGALDLQHIFNTSASVASLDSMVLNKATLESFKKNGVIATYVLSFPKDYYIRKVTMVYDTQKQLPQSVTIISFYADQEQGNKTIGTTYQTTSKDYSLTVPNQVFDLQQYFTVKGGKVILQQFRNYKLSAIL